MQKVSFYKIVIVTKQFTYSLTMLKWPFTYLISKSLGGANAILHCLFLPLKAILRLLRFLFQVYAI